MSASETEHAFFMRARDAAATAEWRLRVEIVDVENNVASFDDARKIAGGTDVVRHESSSYYGSSITASPGGGLNQSIY